MRFLFLLCFVCASAAAFAQTSKPACQVVFKRQPQPFDPMNPKKVTGPYQDIKTLEIPQGISNNNWVRFEGPVWENELIAYRFYSDTRHRFDIFGKRTAALVMDTVKGDYHEIEKWGTDVLKVGEGLGMGSPAFFVGDSALAFTRWSEKKVEVLESGPTVARIRIIFKGLETGRGRIDLENTIEFRPGSRWTKVSMRVLAGDAKSLLFCTGIGKSPAVKTYATGRQGDYTFGYTFGKQSYHNQELGMAIAASKLYKPAPGADRLNHLLILVPDKNGAVSYNFLAAWEMDASSASALRTFQRLVKKELSGLK